MKKQFKISKKAIVPFVSFILLATSFMIFSFKVSSIVNQNSVKVIKKSTCTGDCAAYKTSIDATYNSTNGDKCEAVKQTVNGIIKGQCGCPGNPFDPCNLRLYAINKFTACHFTMSSFINSCP